MRARKKESVYTAQLQRLSSMLSRIVTDGSIGATKLIWMILIGIAGISESVSQMDGCQMIIENRGQ
jgi:hypothetical protein